MVSQEEYKRLRQRLLNKCSRVSIDIETMRKNLNLPQDISDLSESEYKHLIDIMNQISKKLDNLSRDLYLIKKL